MSVRNVNKINLPIKGSWNLLLILLFAGMFFFLSTRNTHSEANRNSAPPVATTNFQVSFKLDPRLLGPTYGGERWVSPSTYGPIAETGKTYSVTARAYRIDAKGNALQMTADWTPADSNMVTVSPSQGHEVNITIQRAGETSVQVISGELLTMLSIKAVYKNNIIQVEISQ